LIELQNNNINAETEKEFKIYYQNSELGLHSLDILVENEVILVNFSEVKADFRRIDLFQ
jgi:hypothetical protein